MIQSRLLAMVIAGSAFAAPVAVAQPAAPEGGDARFSFNRADDGGYLRLDGRTGQVSLCNRRSSGWQCQAVPDEPIVFTKSPNTLIGPNDDVRIPRGSTKPDWEVELGIVIGRRTSYLDSVDEAKDAIAGFVTVNDVSERAFQMERNGQWRKGKSAETFNPAGPWLATPDEIDDVLDLRMWLDVNGVRRQDGSTSTMVFDPFEIVRYLSQFMVLEPGDVINTGTPAGVAFGANDFPYLREGDVVEVEIDRLGRQRHVLGQA